MKTKIIAEIASCHNGSIDWAKAMVRAAAEAGVDYVKFQSWQAKNVKDSDPDKERYGKLELSNDAHYELMQECKKHGVQFMTSIFDRDRIPFLKKLGLNTIKIPSTYCNSEKMIKACRDNFKTVIASTGMSKAEEVERTSRILKGHDFALLHCVSIYPLPKEKVNLKRMLWIKSLAPKWGLSDHYQGTEASKIAISMGADYIEKHFTLSRYLPQARHTTTDEADVRSITTHEIADEPYVFKELCEWRDLVEEMMGSGRKDMWPEEKNVRKKYTDRLGN